jgi:hypothetical protein
MAFLEPNRVIRDIRVKIWQSRSTCGRHLSIIILARTVDSLEISKVLH